MRPRDKEEMLRMLKYDDYSYGFKNLSQSDFESVIKIYSDAGFLRGVEKREEIEKILLDTTYRGDKRDIYGNDLIKSKVLDLPKLLEGKNVKEIRELMERKSISNCRFSTNYYGTYTKAIKVLQQKLNISVTGRYTEDVAVKVYEKVKHDIKTGQGYLASEDDPNRIFKYDFKEYVVSVDQYIWKLCGLEEKFLVDDNAPIWDHEDVDKICQELLRNSADVPMIFLKPKEEYIGLFDGLPNLSETSAVYRLKEIHDQSFAFRSAENSGNREVTSCIEAIEKSAEKKARELLDEIMEERRWVYRYKNKSILEKYKSYSNILRGRISTEISNQAATEALLIAFEIGLTLYVTKAINLQNIQLIKVGGVAAIPAYTEILEVGLNVLIDDQPGFADLYNILKKDPDMQLLAEFLWKENFVENSHWKYVIDDTLFNFRKKFIEKINDLIKDTTFVKFSYNDSIWETSYYNYLIGKYLKTVKLMNEQFDDVMKIRP